MATTEQLNSIGKAEENKKLIEEYPFLLPRSSYSGKVPEGYNYSYTVLDDMPAGWRKKFGLRMCRDIKKSLEDSGMDVKRYQIEDIKEKFGAMYVFDNGGNLEIKNKILPKYMRMSERTCGICGGTATKIAVPWIFPLCDTCANSDRPNSYIDIGYYYGEQEEKRKNTKKSKKRNRPGRK